MQEQLVKTSTLGRRHWCSSEAVEAVAAAAACLGHLLGICYVTDKRALGRREVCLLGLFRVGGGFEDWLPAEDLEPPN